MPIEVKEAIALCKSSGIGLGSVVIGLNYRKPSEITNMAFWRIVVGFSPLEKMGVWKNLPTFIRTKSFLGTNYGTTYPTNEPGALAWDGGLYHPLELFVIHGTKDMDILAKRFEETQKERGANV